MSDLIGRLQSTISQLRDMVRKPAKAPLESRVVPNGLVAPLRFHEEGRRVTRGVDMGVYTSSGQCRPESLLVRNGKKYGRPGQFETGAEIDEDVIYGGMLSAHFGHFLLEGLARLWCAAEFPDRPIVWVSGNVEVSEPQSWHLALMEPLIGQRRHIIVDVPTRFRSVVSADPGLRLPDFFHHRHKQFLEGVDVPHLPEPGCKVWLSRSGIEPTAGLLGSETLERHLELADWTLLRPEEHPVPEQLRTLSRAERVAAEEGSALHLLVLLKNCDRLKVDILARRRKKQRIRGTYHLIAEAKGFAQTLHDVKSERILTRSRAQFTRIAPNFAEHLDALQVPVRPLPEPRAPDQATLEGWAAKAGPFDHCLHIGLGGQYQGVFRLAHATTLISTEARIDPRAAKAAGLETLEMTIGNALDHFPKRIGTADLVILAGPEAGLGVDGLSRLSELEHLRAILVAPDVAKTAADQMQALDAFTPAANPLEGGYLAFLRRR